MNKQEGKNGTVPTIKGCNTGADVVMTTAKAHFWYVGFEVDIDDLFCNR